MDTVTGIVRADRRPGARVPGYGPGLIVGPPRSGTTLLAWILAGSPSDMVVSEPLLAHAVVPDWKLYRFLRRMQRELDIPRAAIPTCPGADGLVVRLGRWAGRTGKRLVLKETFRTGPPEATWPNRDRLDRLVDAAAGAVAVMRDPFDTVASTVGLCRPLIGVRGALTRLRWPTLPRFRDDTAVVEWASRNWRACAEWIGERGLHCVLYESLVRDPEASLEAVANALGRTFDRAWLVVDGPRRFAGLGDPGLLSRPRKVDTASVGRGRARLSGSQQAIVADHCRAAAGALGYSPI